MPKRHAPVWGALAGVSLCAVVLAACGGSSDDSQQTTGTTQPAIQFPATLTTIAPALTGGSEANAAPRWEQLRVVTGNSSQDIPVTISPRAIQWRVKWTCDGGNFVINSTPPPIRPGPLVTSNCPGGGEGFDRKTGDIKLSIQASGPWKATVEQQVDTPLDEPPLPEMASAQVLSRGDFYNVEKTGKGTVILYQLADGRKALRIEPGFEVLNDPDLVIWLSEAQNPKTSKAMSDAPHVELQALKSTRGSQNYIIPDNLGISTIRSVGMYCVPVPSIYIAAALS
ncbi:MAG: DM13 domain-containing protein [Acidimicrobiales bacterium]